MNYYIINEPCGAIRANARQLMNNNWIQVVLGVALYYVLLVMVPEFFQNCVSFGAITQWNGYLQQNQTISVIAAFYQMFFSGVFVAGLCSFLLYFVRLRDINPGYIFNGFEYYLKTLLLMIVMCVFIFLWTVLLIVPGIIAAFRYSQCFYVLADDPKKGIMQCIDESRQMMTGNKMKLFLLDLSFIGWLLLSSIPMAVLMGILQPDNTISYFVIMFVGMIPVYFPIAYMQTANTIFYEMLTGHMRAADGTSHRPFNEADYYWNNGGGNGSSGNGDNGYRQTAGTPQQPQGVSQPPQGTPSMRPLEQDSWGVPTAQPAAAPAEHPAPAEQPTAPAEHPASAEQPTAPAEQPSPAEQPTKTE
ncbi:DUF975 family protein [Hornefia butyriciproducens]|uniref:DUF975 family protein n=1 Tax=Hornefia butyriciproducens TaxID=2652293 RepID=UPI002A914729|nr:DUF975 family protein [Hornefia butyriciproducens]MDY5462444.1 DUF975 family protein [Hornefia butyriciproducens]